VIGNTRHYRRLRKRISILSPLFDVSGAERGPGEGIDSPPVR
jgi:hypothetical protein